jgi:D-amino-acid dehydrogenase
MHVVVLGAGVVGVTTAYAFAEAGARVTVIDRHTGPAQEASAANGGHLSASQARPWATPSVPRQLVRWLGRADAPMRLSLWRWDPGLWRWGTRYLRNCTPARYRANTAAILRLARASQVGLRDMLGRSGVACDLHAGGVLALYRTATSYARARGDFDRFAGAGEASEHEVLSAEACARVEPALARARDRGFLAGGILSRDAATGNAARFTGELAAACAARQVAFRYDTRVERIDSASGRITGVQTSGGLIAADAVVVALGMGSRPLLASLSVDLPLYPVKGYSVTVPIASDEPRLPCIGILDDDRKVVFARLGNRFRAAGTAEFAGFDTRLDERRIRPILVAAQELLPGPLDAVTPATAGAWTGLRPMTPDGKPAIGAVSGYAGLYVNTGHGPLGWTLAAASARMVADLAHGRAPEIDPEPYSVARFRAQ